MKTSLNLDELNIFERKALLTFLKDYINRENLSIYEGSLPRYLFLAFLKLQISVDAWEDAKGYME